MKKEIDYVELGFEHKWYEKGIHSWQKDNYILTSWDNSQKLMIHYGQNKLFDGTCNDLEAVKKLMKDYLNIPI